MEKHKGSNWPCPLHLNDIFIKVTRTEVELSMVLKLRYHDDIRWIQHLAPYSC